MESIQPGLQLILDRGELLKSLRALKRGDFSVRMPLNLTGIDGEIAQAFNDVIELEEAKAAEIARVAEQVGKEGQTGHRMSVAGASGGWAEVIESVNTLVSRHGAPDQRGRARHRRGGEGRPLADAWCSRSTAGRCAASSCASAPWSTPWSSS